MNTCEGYEELISAFIDGMLSDRDRIALMEHMAHCSACQNYFNDQIEIHDAVMDDMDAIRVPDGFAGTVMERVRMTPQIPKTGRPRVIRWRQWAALAACCVLAALGLWKLGPDRPDHAEDVNTADRQIASKAMPETAGSGSAEISGGGIEDTSVTAASDDAAADAGQALPVPETPPVPNPGQPDTKLRTSDTFSQNAGQVQTAAAPPSEAGKSADTEAESVAPSEPASVDPSANTGIALLQEQDSEGLPDDPPYAGILITASPLAAAWVEENLDSVWIAGESYEMNAGEYQALKEFLSAQDAEFSETAGPSGSEGFLLMAAE